MERTCLGFALAFASVAVAELLLIAVFASSLEHASKEIRTLQELKKESLCRQ